MTAKQYLNQAKTLDIEINTKIEELHQLKQNARCIQSVAISERVQSSSINNSNKIIDKIVDLHNEINTEIDKLVDLKGEIRGKINQLDDSLYVAILTEHYINKKSWERIAEDSNFSRRYIFKLYGRALEKFRKKFNME